MRNANLSFIAVLDAAGLVTAIIIGTCAVDEAVMQRSEGQVPEAFLRACGATPAILRLVASTFRQRTGN